jgi:hypothetical protein
MPATHSPSYAQQSVTFGGDNDSDSFAVEQISPHDNTVTVLLRPKGESCNFRFDVSVGRSVQLRTGGPSGETLLCKATLRQFAKDGSAEFGAECSEGPVADNVPKCPAEGDTAAAYPQQ